MELAEFIKNYPLDVSALFEKARSTLLDRFNALCEEPDIPSRIVVYRISPGNSGIVFTLIPSQRGLKLGIYRGRELPDPSGLLQGSGKVHATIQLSENLLNDHALLDLLDSAIQKAQIRATRS